MPAIMCVRVECERLHPTASWYFHLLPRGTHFGDSQQGFAACIGGFAVTARAASRSPLLELHAYATHHDYDSPDRNCLVCVCAGAPR